MTQISSFFDANMVNGVPDREYDATSWANYFKGLIGNGVSITPSSNLQVVAGTGLNVILSPGIAYINGYYYNNTEPLTVPINIANATYPRITSIVIELSLNNREIICKTVDGSAQSSPTAPQITQTESTYQLQLATVYVPAGATSIGAITDTRENTQVCGFLELLVPTIQPTFFKNIILQGTTKNAGTIDGGTLNLNLINAPTINQPTINGGGLTNSILNTPHIENGTCLNTSIVLETKNGAKLDYFCDGKSFRLTNPATWGDLITIPESMDEIDVNVPINTNSGTYNNPTLNGGAWNNPTLNGSIEIEKELDINTNAAGGTINLNTNVKSIYGLTIGGQYGSIFMENQDGQGLVQLCHSNDSVILNNLLTNASIFTFWPSKNNSPSTLSVNNTIVSGTTFNECGFNNGSLNNPTLSGNVEVNNSGAQQALIDYYSGTHTQLVAPNVTGKCTISWWLIKAPLLSGQSINGSIGVLTMSITLDSTYNWSNNNRQEIDISQLPASSARTITPTPYFQVGTSQGVLWLAGSNLTLEAGKTYTTKALMWQ